MINLLEILSKKTLPRHNKHPRIPMQKIENRTLFSLRQCFFSVIFCNNEYNFTFGIVDECLSLVSIAIKWLMEEEKIKLVNIGAEDIFNGNARIILGLIWTLSMLMV